MSEINPYQTPVTQPDQDLHPFSPDLGELARVRKGLYLIYYGIIALLVAVVAIPIIAMILAATSGWL